MESYIGVKLISAEPCYGLNNKCVDPQNEHCGEEKEGYKVVYEDGYTSWSPKDVFEKAYRKSNTPLFECSSEKPHQKRVIVEATELAQNVEKLGLFIEDNIIFKSLSVEEKQRLSNQLLAMKYYLSILVERIENFD